MEAAMITLRPLAFEDPVRWLEGWICHVSGWWHVRLAGLLGPLGAGVGPVVVGKVVVRVVKHLRQARVNTLSLTSCCYKSGQEGYKPRLDEQGAHHAASPPVGGTEFTIHPRKTYTPYIWQAMKNTIAKVE